MHRKRLLKKPFAFLMRNLLGTITEVSTDQKVAALTFDDGPSPEYTPRLLDILDQYQARATFFILGKQSDRFPDIVRRIIDSGHAVGNHTWDHPSLPAISSAERRQQIHRCRRAAGNKGQRLFRPPYGHQDLLSRVELFLLGYKVIAWSIDTQDWLDRSGKEMAETVMQQIRPGSIILFHDLIYTAYDPKYIDRESSFNALQIILDELSNRYQFVTVPELLKLGRPKKTNWYILPDRQFLANLTQVPV